MRYLTVNNLKISKNILGTTYFGTTTDRQTAFSLMDRFVSLGGNTIDTARSYANWLPNGESASEKVIGEWMESYRCRENLCLITKCAFPAEKGKSRLSREEILGDLEQSLYCLKTNYVDILFLHRDDETVPVSQIMPILDEAVRSKKVRMIGTSNWTTERISQANAFAKEKGMAPFSVSEIQWSAAVSTPDAMQDSTLVCMNEHEYQWYLENRFPVFAFSSQAKGIFSKAITQGLDHLNEKIRTRFLNEKNIARIQWVKKYCEAHKVSPATVILSYLNCNPVPAASIIGCSDLLQLEDSMHGADYLMSSEDIRRLASI